MESNFFSRIIDRLRGRRSLAEYYAWLLQHGRITEGRIIDTNKDEKGIVIFYCYDISNVQYESSQLLTPQQLDQGGRYIPGAVVTVRFDPKHPVRSVVQ
jgi:hypothetical protein